MAAPSPRIEIRPHHGRPSLFIDGQPLQPAMYSAPSGRFEDIWPNSIPRFLPHKINVYLMPLPQAWLGHNGRRMFWDGDTVSEEPIFTSAEKVEEAITFVLDRDPDATIVIRLMRREPPSWRELHPDQCVITESGEPIDCPSLASTLFNETAVCYYQAVVRFCQSRSWGNRVIGYVNYERSEGSHRPVIGGHLFDHSPVMLERWRQYLRDTYETEAALRKAHGDPSLSFDTIGVPHDMLRDPMPEAVSHLHWQAGADNRAVRDYLLLTRDLYHGAFRQTCKTLREAAGPDKIILHDTFKLPMLGWTNMGFFWPEASWPVLYPDINAGSGSMNTCELTELDGFDGLCTPYDYQVRGSGGIFEPEAGADSMALRNKLFFVEQDLRTYRGGFGRYGTCRDMPEFTAVTWRDLATAMTRAFNNYYCDHNADYFSEPAMHDVVGRQVEVLKASVDWPHNTVPGIAMIVDDAAALETTGSGHVMNEAIMWEQKMGISRCGVPYRIYPFEDLALDGFPEHRVYYFPNLHRVDEGRMALLREKVFRNGHVVVWGPGSGISDGETIGAEHAARLTGFQFTQQDINYPRRVQITNFDHPITAGLSEDCIYGSPVSYGPVLYPSDGVRLGQAWSKMNDDTAGLSLKEFDNYAALFTTAAPLPADLWRAIARFAGTHVYCETNDVLMASAGLVALHSIKSGPKRLALPGTCAVHDLINDEPVSEATDQIAFDLKAPETRFFRLT